MKLLFRTIYWVIFTLGTLMLSIFYFPVFWWLDFRGNRQLKEKIIWNFVHWWGRVVLAATGSRVKISGLENVPSGPVVVMGNHQSIFDIMLVLGYIEKPLAFIAKKELRKFPLVSSWMKHLGCIFLDRKDPRQAVRVFNQAVNQVKNGWSMVIFPEGTRSRSSTLAPLKKGSMKLPMRAQVPIVPISIEGTYKLFEAHGSKRIGPGEVSLSIGEPIYLQEDMDSTTVSELVRQRIEKGLA